MGPSVSASAMMLPTMPSLRWLAPEGPPRIFSVFKQITTIGRARSNDVAIDHPSLAAHHAQIAVAAGATKKATTKMAPTASNEATVVNETMPISK